MSRTLRPELIVSLDVDTLTEAKRIVNILYPEVMWFKVGSHLFTACGLQVIRFLKGRGARIFLDLKFHDIPTTVANAARVVKRLGVDMFNVHIQGGVEMLKAAVISAKGKIDSPKAKPPFILGVTVLTSQKSSIAKVLKLSRLAKKAGLDGVVASVHEAESIKKNLGASFIVLTPGIRVEGRDKGDQVRVATPQEAKKSQVDFIVVGRPIIKAKDPRRVARSILNVLKDE